MHTVVLSIAFFIVMLSVIIRRALMLSVAGLRLLMLYVLMLSSFMPYAKCRFTDSNHAECSDAECQCAMRTYTLLVHVTLVIIFIGLSLQSTN